MEVLSLSCEPGEQQDNRVVCAHCERTLQWLRLSFNYKRLRREPYFKRPEGRAVLELLQRRYPHDPRVLNWLVREYRRGRLGVSPQWLGDIQGLIQAEQNQDEQAAQHYNQQLDHPDRPDIVLWNHEAEGHPEPVQPGIVSGIGQMMDRGVGGRGVDIMNHTYNDFMPIYERWNSERRQRDPNAGEVVHQFPNGWSMRRLTTPDEAYDEGEAMQNCVPKFAPGIQSGDVHIFSLRDPRNEPHANVLIQPGEDGHWASGHVRDIRGKQNARPVDDYRNMLVDWFNTLSQKPPVRWDPTPPGMADHPGQPEDYGLEGLDRYGAWDFTAGWDGFARESNFNKVRNMLRKNNQLTDENNYINEWLRGYFGQRPVRNNGEIQYELDPNWPEDMGIRRKVVEDVPEADPYAEWLHREVRKGRLKLPESYQSNIDGNFNNLLEYMKYLYNDAPGAFPEGFAREDIRTTVTPEMAEEYARALAEGENTNVLGFEHNHPDILNYGDGAYWQRHVGDAARRLVIGKNPRPHDQRGFPQYVDPESGQSIAVKPDVLPYLAKILQRRKDRGEEANIMKLQAPELFEEAKKEANLQRILNHGGIVEHEFPDGWTMRRINDPEAATLEGELMGHCIGGYTDDIAAGNSLNYSLRDAQGFPHSTFEIKTTRPPRLDADKALIDPVAQQLLNAPGRPDDYYTPGQHKPGLCSNCNSPLTANGVCPKCNPTGKALLDKFQELFDMQARGEEPRYQVAPDLYRRWHDFKVLGIENGWLSPDPRNGSAYQIQGKGNVAPDPKYHKYIYDWVQSFPEDERPTSGWRSYFRPQPARYPGDLQQVVDKADEFGFLAPNREVEYDEIVKALNGQPKLWTDPHSTQKQFQAPRHPDENDTYRPELGNQVYEFAKSRGELKDLYKAVNDWNKAQAPNNSRGGDRPPKTCPNCGSTRTDYTDYHDGFTFCQVCQNESRTERWPVGNQVQVHPNNPDQAAPKDAYSGAMTEHLGGLLAQHPELQQWAMHDAPATITPRCPNCNGEIGACMTCPGRDHGACTQCGALYYYPQQQEQQQAQPNGVLGSWHFGQVDCPLIRYEHHWPVPHEGPNGETCHCLWNPVSHQ